MKKTPSRREDDSNKNNNNNSNAESNNNSEGMYYPEDEEDYVPSCSPLPNDEELQQPFVIDQLFEFDAPQYFEFDEFDNPTYQQQYFNISMNPLTGDITTTRKLLNDVDWFLSEHPELEPLDEVDFSSESTSIDQSPRSHATDTTSAVNTPPNTSYRTPPTTTPEAARAMSPLIFKTPQRRHIATPLSPSLAKLGKAVRIVSASPLAPLTPSGLASPLRRPLTGPSPLRVTLTSFTEHRPLPFTEHKPQPLLFTEQKITPVTAPSPPKSLNNIVPPSPKPAASSIVPPSPKQVTLISAQPRRIVRTSPSSAAESSVVPTSSVTVSTLPSVNTKPATRAVRVAKENRLANRVGAVTKVTVRASAQPREPVGESSARPDVLKEVTRMLAEHNKKIRDQHREQVLERAKKPSVRQVKQFASSDRTRSKSTSPLL